MNYLLASDMDGTVIPLDDAASYRKAIEQLHELKRRCHMAIAYVTGRRLELALQGVGEWQLPEPDYCVCDVGTSVYTRSKGTWQNDEAYQDLLEKRMGGHRGDDVLSAFEDSKDVRPQERECQAPFKASFYCDARLSRDDVKQLIEPVLARHTIHGNVIFSIDSKKDIGLIDILPVGVAKDFALHYLLKITELAPEKMIYAGDSGNDLPAFMSGYKAVIVANTPAWVQQKLKAASTQKGAPLHLYFSPQKYTAGVVDGLHHYGVEPSGKDYSSSTL